MSALRLLILAVLLIAVLALAAWIAIGPFTVSGGINIQFGGAVRELVPPPILIPGGT